MDTTSPRDKAAQPWCDGISGEVQGTDNLLTNVGLNQYTQAGYTEDLTSNPDFYTAFYADGWTTEQPGWLVSAQETSDTSDQAIFWQ